MCFQIFFVVFTNKICNIFKIFLKVKFKKTNKKIKYVGSAAAKLLQLCPLCDPIDYSPPGSSILGILQARMLEWFAMPHSRGSFQLRYRTGVSYVSCFGRKIFLSLASSGKPSTRLITGPPGSLENVFCNIKVLTFSYETEFLL